MAGVRQGRVLLNVVCILGLCVLMLWLVRTRLWEHRVALAIGGGTGVVFGPWWWPLTPTGKVALAGVLWNAVSRSGEPIDIGRQVEVLSVDPLTLSVDRLPDLTAASQDGETT